jgi:hypothetical protein
MRRFLLALVLAAPLAGCPGSLEDPGRFAGEFGTGGGSTTTACPDVPTLLSTTCTMSGCHAATMPAAGLDLASPGVFMRLSGKMASGGPGLLVDPSNPASSILYLKLKTPPPFGSRMPLVGMPLDDAVVACVLTWIEQGGAP